ncbi:MAG TPA: energy-coupling factor transporter transmembrane component T [Spirochaetales bacterium]|nr:energy-coupling factor transporter transmembrane component T [Spirochaetales bacterium]HRY56170.1 energy-coupling factor transporter transmembrane component T [Spirochaetia bacterium]
MARLGSASKLAPSSRLLCLALFSSASFLMSAPAAGTCAAILILLVLGEGVGPLRLLRDSLFLAWLGLFAALAQGLDFTEGIRLEVGGLRAAAEYCLRLATAFLAGRLFYASTTRAELREAATRAATLLPGRGRRDLGLSLSLVLGFMPLIAEEWRSTLEAAKARGIRFGKGAGAGLQPGAALLTAYLRRLMLAAVYLPEALAARGWRGEGGVSFRRWKGRDYITVAALSALLAITALHVV